MDIRNEEGLEIFHEGGTNYAYVIRVNADIRGIRFVTETTDDFQLGLMSRGPETPVHEHVHNPYVRTTTATSEFLVVRAGQVRVSLRSRPSEMPTIFELGPGDAVLFPGVGIHGITFGELTELIEVKQGPYDPSLDKRYISHLRAGT